MRSCSCAEGQIDLVVDHEHALERQLQRAAGRTDRAPGVVHVGLRAQHRDRRRAAAVGPAAPAGAPGAAARESGPCRAGSSQRSASSSATMEADVVARPGVLAAGVAEPDDQPVDGPATATEGASQRPLLLSGGGLRRAAPRPPRSASSSPTSSVSDSISSSTSVCSLGGESVASTVSSSSPSSVTPSGALQRGEHDRVADLHLADLVHDRLGDRRRQRFDLELAGDLLEHARPA